MRDFKKWGGILLIGEGGDFEMEQEGLIPLCRL